MALQRNRRRISGFNKVILFVHFLVIASLLTAIAAKYISPALFWLPAFFGLAFPYLFTANLIFCIYWFTLLKPVVAYGAAAFLISLPTASRFVQVSTGSGEREEKALKITSYNSMLFDLYNWSKNKESRSGILHNLSEIDPDILCLQEFYTSEEQGDFNNLDTIKKLLGTPYGHVAFTTTLRKFDHWGIATFSRYPIINEGTILFNTRSNNVCIFSDIVIGQDTVRVYNLHLQSISFSRKEHEFYEKVFSSEGKIAEMKNSTNILRRLKMAFVKRTEQAEMVVSHMKTSPYPVIVCGDFNDTAASYAYERISHGLSDAFNEKGNGLGRTYAGKWPQFRIDYILYDPGFECVAYQKSEETFTDHFAITASFELSGL